MRDDYNGILLTKNYMCHQGQVSALEYSLEDKWLLSVGHDKFFHFHCTQTGKQIGGHQGDAWFTALQYP